MPGVKRKQSTQPKEAEGEKKSKVPKMKDIDEWFVHRRAIKEVAKTSNKMPPLIQAETLKQQNKAAVEGGVNSSGVEKLVQYEVHERLHLAYEGKKLKKTLLSHYLKHFEKERHKALKWMGSELAPENVAMPSAAELPEIWLRLAKIPPVYVILGDKGFEKATRMNPNLNHVQTPYKLSDEQVVEYRKSQDMIIADRETSYTRVPVEDGYGRYRDETILKDRVPYWVIAMLPFAHEWAHANINLSDPIRKPGSSSIVAEIANYWDKHCDC